MVLSSLITFLFFSALFSYLVVSWLKIRSSDFVDPKILDAPQRWIPAKPTLGGILFFIAFVLGSMISGLSITIFLAAFVAFLLGLWDDLRRISPMIKLAGQFLSAAILVAGGFRFELFHSNMDIAVTIFFVVVIMNSFNMLDNMDAIATIVAIGIFTSAIGLSFLHSSIVTNDFYLIMLSALAVFLYFNWHPSKIFMGDSGSMLLGILIAHVFLKLPAQQTGMNSSTQVISAITLLAIPAVDTAVVVINRLRHGKSPLLGGRDHTTHNLVYLGLRDVSVARMMIALMVILILLSFRFLLLTYNENVDTQIELTTPSTNWHFALPNIIFIAMLFLSMFIISLRNLQQGKYHYSR